MRCELAALVLLVVGTVAATPATPIAQQAAAATQQKLPPLSYVCPMPGDEDVIDDKPGDCPKCKMSLVPIRLDAKYSCPVHSTQEVKDGPGKCRFDGRELVPVTLSVFWTCPGDATHLMEPGACASGQPRRVGYEVRAHGDHNPRHGGQFFMAQDAWHHIEATIQPGQLFRVFFYDNFTKPIAAKDFQARVVTKEAWDPIAKKTNELEAFPLKLGRDGQTMEATLKNVTFPLKVSALVKFGGNSPEQRFDFNFADLSKEPAAAPAAITTSAQPSAATPAAAARTGSAPAAPSSAVRSSVAPSSTVASNAVRANAAAAATPASAAQAPAAAPKPSEQEPAGQARPVPIPRPMPASEQPTTPAPAPDPADVELGGFSAIPAALNAALDESTLPTGIPALLAELSKRGSEVEQMVNEGNLGQVWLPAMGTKTVALALSEHTSTLPETQRAVANLAVKRVITSSWELDAFGDMGNKQKMSEAYARLASAIADLKGAYAPAR